MAQHLSLSARPLKLDMEHLPELKLPCVLHWDLNHFVVLQSLSGRFAVIHDPAVGQRKLTSEEFSRHFTGVALELTPSENFNQKREIQKFSMLFLMGRVVGMKQGLSQILLLGLALQVCLLLAPFYIQWIVDEALVSADRDLITVLGLGFFGLIIIQTAITAVRSWVTIVLSTSLNFQWFGNAFAHLMKLPLSYFANRHSGDIVSRFSSIQTIQRSMTTQFVEGIIDGVLVIGTLAIMVFYSVKLAAIALTAVVLYVLLRWSIFRSLRAATAEQIIHAAKQQTHFLESVRGLQSIRLFGREQERRTGWMNILADQFNADLHISKLSVSYQTANTLLFSGERIIVIWLAALAVLDNQFSVGMLIAFISYKDQFKQRTASLVDKLFELRMMRLHGERLADILLTEPEHGGQDVEADLGNITASIELRNVSFRYADSEPYVLTQISLAIPAGQSIAITGSSGCGKSTLMKLLLGLITPTEGEILIGGIRIEHLGLLNYRKMIGTVMQDDYLFSGSVGDNICFFDPSRSQPGIEACAQMASVHTDIAVMPMGYNTLVGDIGTGLSGGQKQRILLARALYRKPKLLILDEATSHLDMHNEHAVNLAIQQLPLTRIIVAHRSETIAMAQRVVVLHQGVIVHDAFPQHQVPVTV